MAHNWTKSQVENLQNLKARYDTHQGKGRGKFGRRGFRLDLSERQYVIARFRTVLTGNEAIALSDQAIWAKYQRVNGMLAGKGGAKFARHNVEVAGSFNSGTLTLLSGFGSDSEFNDWKTLIGNAGLKRLGGGISREVWALDDNHVLKVGYHAGRRHNKDEAAIWQKFGGTADGKHLAKVVAVDTAGRWLVMERVRNGEGRNANAAVRAAARRMKISDLHAGNVGTNNAGIQVILDYACGM